MLGSGAGWFEFEAQAQWMTEQFGFETETEAGQIVFEAE